MTITDPLLKYLDDPLLKYLGLHYLGADGVCPLVDHYLGAPLLSCLELHYLARADIMRGEGAGVVSRCRRWRLRCWRPPAMRTVAQQGWLRDDLATLCCSPMAPPRPCRPPLLTPRGRERRARRPYRGAMIRSDSSDVCVSA